MAVVGREDPQRIGLALALLAAVEARSAWTGLDALAVDLAAALRRVDGPGGEDARADCAASPTLPGSSPSGAVVLSLAEGRLARQGAGNGAAAYGTASVSG